jgi:hypothetical protein
MESALSQRIDLDLLVQKSVRVGTHELKQMLLAQLLAELAQKLA